jgi:hypothetical protein
MMGTLLPPYPSGTTGSDCPPVSRCLIPTVDAKRRIVWNASFDPPKTIRGWRMTDHEVDAILAKWWLKVTEPQSAFLKKTMQTLPTPQDLPKVALNEGNTNLSFSKI